MRRFNAIAALAASFSLLLLSCDREKTPTVSIGGPDTKAAQHSGHFENLKELSWLIGDWVDEDEAVDLQLSYQWDKSKNFLIEHFKMEISKGQQFEGFQIIGWDPSQNKIRSWIFDTDGGFGESNWFNKNDTWYTRTVFTLDDGRRATAIHIYKQLDDNTYTFSSENREIGGIFLPNLGPFKVVRKKG